MSDARPVLHTPRLRLRPYRAADRAWFVALFTDPEVMRHVGGAQDAEVVARTFDAACRGSSVVVAAWCAEQDGFAVGHGALLREGGDLGLGFILPRRSWGKGLATEIGRALIDHALHTLGRSRVIASVDDDHAASCRVLEKLGLGFSTYGHDDEGAYRIYAIERDA